MFLKGASMDADARLDNARMFIFLVHDESLLRRFSASLPPLVSAQKRDGGDVGGLPPCVDPPTLCRKWATGNFWPSIASIRAGVPWCNWPARRSPGCQLLAPRTSGGAVRPYWTGISSWMTLPFPIILAFLRPVEAGGLGDSTSFAVLWSAAPGVPGAFPFLPVNPSRGDGKNGRLTPLPLWLRVIFRFDLRRRQFVARLRPRELAFFLRRAMRIGSSPTLEIGL